MTFTPSSPAPSSHAPSSPAPSSPAPSSPSASLTPDSAATHGGTDPVRLAEMTGLMPLADTTACEDPVALYHRLRRRYGPVIPVCLERGAPGRPDINGWLVIGYRPLLEVVRDERTYSRDPGRHWRDLREENVPPTSPLGPMMFPRNGSLYFSDGAQREQLLAPVLEGLNAIDTLALRRTIQRRCLELIEVFAEQGTADLVADYARQIPLLVVAEMFGLPPGDGHDLVKAMIALVGAGQDAQEGSQALTGMLHRVVTARRSHPTGDMTSLFIDHLRDDGVILENMVMVIVAGWETTATWIAQTLRLMLTDPRFAGQLSAGRLSVTDALAEVLWDNPPMNNMPARYATGDTTLAGQPIAAGDPVILGLAGANHDPAVRPSTSPSTSTSPGPGIGPGGVAERGSHAHLAFSAGVHGCPARDPAQLIAEVSVETALWHLPDLRLVIPADRISLQPSPWARGPARLPVEFAAPPLATCP